MYLVYLYECLFPTLRVQQYRYLCTNVQCAFGVHTSITVLSSDVCTYPCCSCTLHLRCILPGFEPTIFRQLKRFGAFYITKDSMLWQCVAQNHSGRKT
jgi:hypothetical protein